MSNQSDFEKVKFHKNNARVEPFVYKECEKIPGLIAVSVDEYAPKILKSREEETDENS